MINTLKMFSKNLIKNEDGLTMLEYAIGGVLIILAIIVIVGLMGNTMKDKFTSITNALKTH